MDASILSFHKAWGTFKQARMGNQTQFALLKKSKAGRSIPYGYENFSEFVLCYTVNMQDQPLWSVWAHNLHRWGLGDFTAALLEAGGPLNYFLAQIFYAGKPFLGGSMPAGEWEALARLLEDRQASHSFAAFLREGTSH